MAKSELHLRAIKLREEGESVRSIAKMLGVSRGTASLWVRHVNLTLEQAEKLKSDWVKGVQRGRLVNALRQKHARLARVEAGRNHGLSEIGDLSKRDLNIMGLSLYWAEGSKKNKSISFCNSDPDMVITFLKWLEVVYRVSRQDIACYVGINEAHRQREGVVKDYWSQLTGIPLSNFTKTSFKNYPLKKVYANFDEHYGTLTLKMRKPGRIYHRILGGVFALSKAGIKPG